MDFKGRKYRICETRRRVSLEWVGNDEFMVLEELRNDEYGRPSLVKRLKPVNKQVCCK